MTTKTVYVLRMNRSGARDIYRTGRGALKSTLDFTSRRLVINNYCLRCENPLDHTCDYVVMRTTSASKSEWWEDYVGSVCVDCFKTADEHGRIYIPAEEVQA